MFRNEARSTVAGSDSATQVVTAAALSYFGSHFRTTSAARGGGLRSFDLQVVPFAGRCGPRTKSGAGSAGHGAGWVHRAATRGRGGLPIKKERLLDTILRGRTAVDIVAYGHYVSSYTYTRRGDCDPSLLAPMFSHNRIGSWAQLIRGVRYQSESTRARVATGDEAVAIGR